MNNKIFLTGFNILISIIVALLILVILQRDSSIIGVRHTIVNISLLVVFVISGIINVYGQIRNRKIVVGKTFGVVISIIGIMIMIYSIKTGSNIRRSLTNTIISYSGKVCFNFDYKCKVIIDNKIVNYKCQSELVGTMTIHDGMINKSYKKLNMIPHFNSVYSEEVNDSMIIQYQVTPDQYINVKLTNNKGQIGSAPYKSCQSLISPVTKYHTIEL